MNKVTIVGLIVTKHGISLIDKVGKTMDLPQTTWKTKSIIDAALPQLALEGVCEIDLDEFSLDKQIAAVAANVQIRSTVEGFEILTESGPINAGRNLDQYIIHALHNGSGFAFSRFLERMAAINRNHTTEELLAFMKNARMPIADDGSIIGFKRLVPTGEPGRYVDPYSKTVQQGVGSRVSMPESLVDDDRRKLCSTGLHIASRDYLKTFTEGDVFLVKVDPRDVISVPQDEVSKMRVCAYHIVAQLPFSIGTMFRLDHYDPLEDDEFRRILANVVAGAHMGITEEVKVPMRTQEQVSRNEYMKPVIERVAEPEEPAVSVEYDEKRVTFDIPTIDPVSVRDTVKDMRSVFDLMARAGSYSGAIDAAVKDELDVPVKNPLPSPKKAKATNGKAKSARAAEYEKKLRKALKMIEKGSSIREVAKKLKMDRDALSRHVKLIRQGS